MYTFSNAVVDELALLLDKVKQERSAPHGKSCLSPARAGFLYLHPSAMTDAERIHFASGCPTCREQCDFAGGSSPHPPLETLLMYRMACQPSPDGKNIRGTIFSYNPQWQPDEAAHLHISHHGCEDCRRQINLPTVPD